LDSRSLNTINTGTLNIGTQSMARGIVVINSPLGRDIFINGNYAEPLGVSPGPFDVELGPHTFETLDSESRVDYRGAAEPSHAHPNAAIELDPVVPPEPV
jgi:hypothetical protein